MKNKEENDPWYIPLGILFGILVTIFLLRYFDGLAPQGRALAEQYFTCYPAKVETSYEKDNKQFVVCSDKKILEQLKSE